MAQCIDDCGRPGLERECEERESSTGDIIASISIDVRWAQLEAVRQLLLILNFRGWVERKRSSVGG